MWRVFGIKLQTFSPATVLKRDSSHGCFPVKFAKFFKTPIWRISANCWLLLIVSFWWLSLPLLFFSVQAQTEIIEGWWSKSPLCRLYFPQCLSAYNHAENILRLTTGSFDLSFHTKPQNKLRLLRLYTLILSCGVLLSELVHAQRQ